MEENNHQEFFASLKEIVKDKLCQTGDGHDFDHTLRVLACGEKLLMQLPFADALVVKTAIILHDIARPLESQSCGKICHAQMGSQLVPEILQGFNLDDQFISKVANCVRCHRYRDNAEPTTIEEKIVYDADKLDSMGAIGIGRAFLFAGNNGARLHNTKEEALNSKEYSKEDTAYREYLVKLSFLKDRMQTTPGKALAIERHKFMEMFFHELNEEVLGNK